MSRIICLADTKVKPTRRTDRPSSSFGAGILASRPYAGVMPYGQADLDEAARMFADSDPEPDYDAMAAQRAWEDAYEAGLLTPVEFGLCLACLLPSDSLTEQGLSDRCDVIACETSTTQRTR